MHAVPNYFSLKPYSQSKTNGCRLLDTKLQKGLILGFFSFFFFVIHNCFHVKKNLKKSNVKSFLCAISMLQVVQSYQTAFLRLLTLEIERTAAVIEF